KSRSRPVLPLNMGAVSSNTMSAIKFPREVFLVPSSKSRGSGAWDRVLSKTWSIRCLKGATYPKMESVWEMEASTVNCWPWISVSCSGLPLQDNKKQKVTIATNCLKFKSFTCLSLLSRFGRLFTFVKMHKNMFIKGLQDKFKVKSGLKYLKGELERPQEPIDDGKAIQCFGCMRNCDQFDGREVFYELIEEFSLRPNATKSVRNKREHDKNSPFSIQMFSERDL